MDFRDGLKKADTIIIATAHSEYREFNPKNIEKTAKKCVKLIDLWNIYEGKFEKNKNIDYIGLGRGDLR